MFYYLLVLPIQQLQNIFDCCVSGGVGFSVNPVLSVSIFGSAPMALRTGNANRVSRSFFSIICASSAFAYLLMLLVMLSVQRCRTALRSFHLLNHWASVKSKMAPLTLLALNKLTIQLNALVGFHLSSHFSPPFLPVEYATSN